MVGATLKLQYCGSNVGLCIFHVLKFSFERHVMDKSPALGSFRIGKAWDPESFLSFFAAIFDFLTIPERF